MEVQVDLGLTYDGGRDLPLINLSDIPASELGSSPELHQLARQLSNWIDSSRSFMGGNPAGGNLLSRGSYTPPSNPIDDMRTARHALKTDSIVSGVAENTEAFAFQGIKWASQDPDEADAFNQLATDQNLDAKLRAMWRDEYAMSSTIVAKVWGPVEYTVRGTTKAGNRRKRVFKFWAPKEIKTLDPINVIPVGTQSPLAPERLAWQATQMEVDAYTERYTGNLLDSIMQVFYAGQYTPEAAERNALMNMGVNPYVLMEINPEYVFRHCATKGDYERYPDVRLKSCFELLDLKQQLLLSDRATLVGAANYLLLVRKGSDQWPAQPPELKSMRENFNLIAKLPVIFGDHRLSIDIIAPARDLTLIPEKYEVLDSRLLARLLGTLVVSSGGSRATQNEAQIATSVARTMSNRRHLLRRSLEMQIGRAVVRHPRNAGVFVYEPNLTYIPESLTLQESAVYAQALLALRTQREISRETVLEYFGLDESVEALRVENERETYDSIFKSMVPFSGTQPQGAPGEDGSNDGQGDESGQNESGNGEPPAASGRRGGRPAGGGDSAKSPEKTAKSKTEQGNPKTKAESSS